VKSARKVAAPVVSSISKILSSVTPIMRSSRSTAMSVMLWVPRLVNVADRIAMLVVVSMRYSICPEWA
jgi:hypothetical protein